MRAEKSKKPSAVQSDSVSTLLKAPCATDASQQQRAAILTQFPRGGECIFALRFRQICGGPEKRRETGEVNESMAEERRGSNCIASALCVCDSDLV